MVPVVSVLVPTYNRSGLLRETVASILAQEYTDFEIVVADNCSTDDTQAVIAAFDDPRIKYYRNALNLGPVHNHNRALRQATGRYICTFSDDDIMLPSNLAAKVAVLEQYPQVGIVHSNIHEIDKTGAIFSEGHWVAHTNIWQRLTGDSLMAARECYALLYHGRNFISMPSTLVRRSVLEAQKLEFNNQLGYLYDWDLWLKLATCTDFYFIKEPLVLYRHHENNEAKQVTSNIYFQELMLIKLSLLEPAKLTTDIVATVNQVTGSVKKQLMLDAKLARALLKQVFRYLPIKQQLKQLLGRA